MTANALVSESLFIPSDTPDIQLHLLHRYRRDITAFDETRTIVMMHGATYSSGSLYDTPAEGRSFLDVLAEQGFNVYAVDVRGYGKSTRPPEMRQPAEAHPPAVGTAVGVRDFGSAVDFVLRTNGLSQVNIIGMSWGGTVTGAFTSLNNQKVRRLGLIAPQWLSKGPFALDSGGPLHAWRTVNVGETRARWLRETPEDKRATLIPEGVFEAWVNNTVSTEPEADLRARQAIRASNGPIQDIRDYWSVEKPYYDPANITVPLLLIHGEWDRDVLLASAQAWFLQASGSPDKRWLEIGEATHMVVLEKNRHHVFNALISFFREN